MLIAIDTDGVLIDTTNPTIKYLNLKYHKNLQMKDLTKPHWWRLWGVPDKEIIKDFNYLVKTRGIDFEPVPGAVEVVRALAKKHDLISITGRDRLLTLETERIHGKYFNNDISRVYYTEGFSDHGPVISKGELASWLKVDLMIDDSLLEALDCNKHRVRSFLLNYPYNQGDLPKSVERFSYWTEIQRRLLSD